MACEGFAFECATETVSGMLGEDKTANDLKLYYLNVRMYDPKIARFLQEDTYTGDPNDPLSLNLYTYCFNNPLAYYDPTGHIAVTAYINGVQITFDPSYRDVKTNPDGTNEYFGRSFIEFVYEESSKVNIKDPSYYYNKWDSPSEKVTFWGTLTDGDTWKQMATDTFEPIKNFFKDIFTDEDRTDKSMFSYTPETKEKYDEEKIDRWISPGGSIYDDYLNESGKAFGEIKDYGVDKGTDEAAKYIIGKGFEKVTAPILGSIMRKSGDDVVEGGIRASDDIIEQTGKTTVTAGKKFKQHFLDHKKLLENVTGKKYPKLKEDGPRFLEDIGKIIDDKTVEYVGKGTLKKGEAVCDIYRGKGITVVIKSNGEWSTILETGSGLDKAIEFVK